MKKDRIRWNYKSFTELTGAEVYEILKLRQEVFIVEQNSICADADGLDREAQHLMGWEEGRLDAYARILPPGNKYPEHSIGRVIIRPDARGDGFGFALLAESLRRIRIAHGDLTPIRISAQAHLARRFYGRVGFVAVSDPYLEDGIPHVEMLRSPQLDRQRLARLRPTPA
jgi:ElaA protein